MKNREISDSWFNLGDSDYVENKKKKKLLDKGILLQEIIKRQKKKFGINKANIFPMTNTNVETFITSKRKKIHFQEYLIKYKMKPKIDKITFKNIRKSKPAKGILNKISQSELIIFCPSNPIISVEPILSVPGIRREVKKSKAIKVAISPIVGKKAFKSYRIKLFSTFISWNLSKFFSVKRFRIRNNTQFRSEFYSISANRNNKKNISRI